jgi:hypothetical protein
LGLLILFGIFMADLLTLDDYKIFEGISSTTNDEKFEQLITSVSTLVRSYCGREFDAYTGSPGKTDIFDIQWDTPHVQLEESPVISILNVYERTSQSEAYTELYRNGTNDKYEWYFDSATDSIIRTHESGGYRDWPMGVGAVKVVYTAGYIDLPEDLRMAVADLVTYYHKQEYRKSQAIGGTVREGIPQTAVGDAGFPDHIRRVLNHYRDV